MPSLDIFQIEAFADAVFRGNPAAVCPLTEWLPEEVMQAIAVASNLSETAFFVSANDGYDLRWFTPALVVELCGHATLASAYLMLTRLTPGDDAVEFETRSCKLTVTRDGDRFCLAFPPIAAKRAPIRRICLPGSASSPDRRRRTQLHDGAGNRGRRRWPAA